MPRLKIKKRNRQDGLDWVLHAVLHAVWASKFGQAKRSFQEFQTAYTFGKQGELASWVPVKGVIPYPKVNKPYTFDKHGRLLPWAQKKLTVTQVGNPEEDPSGEPWESLSFSHMSLLSPRRSSYGIRLTGCISDGDPDRVLSPPEYDDDDDDDPETRGSTMTLSDSISIGPLHPPSMNGVWSWLPDENMIYDPMPPPFDSVLPPANDTVSKRPLAKSLLPTSPSQRVPESV